MRDLDGQSRYTLNAATPMYLASAVKVAVVIALFRLAEAKELDLDESVTLREEDLRDGSPLSDAGVVGRTMTLRELARAMMTQSDNLATDVLVRRIGVARLNELWAERFPELLPITSMLEVRQRVFAELDPALASLSPVAVREVRELKGLAAQARRLSQLAGRRGAAWSGRDLERAWERYYATQVNSAPMETMGALLEALARGELLSAAGTAEVLAIMRDCATGRGRLRKYLPDEVVFAHKTGTLHHRACNVGIMTPDGRGAIVVALCTKEFSDLAAAEKAMADIGKAIYETISAEPPAAAPEPTPPTPVAAPPPATPLPPAPPRGAAPAPPAPPKVGTPAPGPPASSGSGSTAPSPP